VVNGLSSGVQQIAAGGIHNCAMINGGLQCLGSAIYDEVGNPGEAGVNFSPLPVVGLIGLPSQ
jgi:hypothetical protein